MPEDSNAPRARLVPFVVGLATLVCIGVVWFAVEQSGPESESDDLTSSSSAPGSESASGSASPSPSESSPAPVSVDLDGPVQEAIADRFPALVPAELPAGWVVTDATYTGSDNRSWQVSLATATGEDVVLTQVETGLAAAVEGYLGADAVPGEDVDLSAWGTGSWQSFTTTTAAGIAKRLPSTVAVLAGPDVETVVELAQVVITAEDAGGVAAE